MFSLVSFYSKGRSVILVVRAEWIRIERLFQNWCKEGKGLYEGNESWKHEGIGAGKERIRGRKEGRIDSNERLKWGGEVNLFSKWICNPNKKFEWPESELKAKTELKVKKLFGFGEGGEHEAEGVYISEGTDFKDFLHSIPFSFSTFHFLSFGLHF